ncbi:MAG: ribonuclease III [Pseudomonadales bacterium]|nr:ribonuclease III [Pseudomonadales bacterium]
MSKLSGLIKKIGYEFENPELLKLALSHCSVGKANNERLEFLGDSVLGFVISHELFTKFPQASEGELSRFRAALVQKATLAEIARNLGLGNYLILGSGELKSGGANRDSILADALEAVICALFIDAGLQVCRDKVIQWFAPRLQRLDLGEPQKDAKTRLQEYLQAKKIDLPQYEVSKVTGQDHDQIFYVRCSIAVLPDAISGQGSSRREAEQNVARLALAALGLAP